ASRQALLPENLISLVGDDVGAGHVDAKGQGPLTVTDARFVRRDEDSGGNDDGVQASVGKHYMSVHLRHAIAPGDIAGESNRRAAVTDAGAGNADPFATDIDDLLRRDSCSGLVEVGADDMSSFSGEAMGGGPADP